MSDKLPGYRLSVHAVMCCVDMAGWPTDMRAKATAVAMAESSGKPGALNDSSGTRGLFQIDPKVWASATPGGPNMLFAPISNCKVATTVYAETLKEFGDGWHAWETVSNGAYLAYEAQAMEAASWLDGQKNLGHGQQVMQIYLRALLDTMDQQHADALSQAEALSGALTNVGTAIAGGAGEFGSVVSATGPAVAGAVADVPGVKQANALAGIGDLAVGAGKWLSNPNNWMRILFVGMGAVLLVAGTSIISRPVTQPIAQGAAAVTRTVKKVPGVPA